MTICRITDDTIPPIRKPIPIQFIKYSTGLVDMDYWIPTCYKPRDWKNIELISGIRNNNNKRYYDIMFAYDDDRNHGVVILGYWNDGVAE